MWDSSVSIGTRLKARNNDTIPSMDKTFICSIPGMDKSFTSSISGMDKTFISSPKCPDQLWGPSSLQFH